MDFSQFYSYIIHYTLYRTLSTKKKTKSNRSPNKPPQRIATITPPHRIWLSPAYSTSLYTRREKVKQYILGNTHQHKPLILWVEKPSFLTAESAWVDDGSRTEGFSKLVCLINNNVRGWTRKWTQANSWTHAGSEAVCIVCYLEERKSTK